MNEKNETLPDHTNSEGPTKGLWMEQIETEYLS